MNTTYNQIVQDIEGLKIEDRQKRRQADADFRRALEVIRERCGGLGHVMKPADGIFGTMDAKPACAVCGWWDKGAVSQ